MNESLKPRLEVRLRKLPDVTVSLWKDTDLMCVFYRGKEIAHFHDHQEIDIRMSQPFIKQEALSPLADSAYHPGRSKKSRWMQIRFTTEQDTERILNLIRRLIAEEYEGTNWGG